MIDPNVCTALERFYGSKIVSSSRAHGGSINEAFFVSFSDGEEFFLKYHHEPPEGFFAAEVHGLQALAEPGEIRVPRVVHFEERLDDRNLSLLLLEKLEADTATPKKQEEFGRALARLHQTSSDRWGLARDNFIGLLPQVNRQAEAAQCSWGEFFSTRRLLPQASLGRSKGWFTQTAERLFEAKRDLIISKLHRDGQIPSLLHGDLWSGNVFWSKQGAALIDPAVYYGDREADIAMLELFGSPPRSFREAYEEVFPLEDGYEQRKVIHNLYHLMNHANLFGGSYVPSVLTTLETL
ncbi:MAG: fructosamine kinase family protein [Bdellovibrionales bacterium]|nr:fructosamine kinase family protein [Bdellovibrionales bacterium]